MSKAKPFIKWAGGKGQLIEQLEDLLPADFDNWDDVTYIEPFVGGGAMLFYMLQAHPNITHAVVNDINPKLTACYEIIRDFPNQLIASLACIQEEYYALEDEEAKRDFFMRRRAEFNGDADRLKMSTLFIFLNRTCFNGLYRENKRGDFNVPFGKFFDDLYADYRIDRVWAKRNVNSVASKRGKLTEILVHNYLETKKTSLFDDVAFAAEDRPRLIV